MIDSINAKRCSIVSRAAARCIPNCRHRVVPGAGHMWPDEDPAGFTAAIIDFLTRASGGQHTVK